MSASWTAADGRTLRSFALVFYGICFGLIASLLLPRWVIYAEIGLTIVLASAWLSFALIADAKEGK